MIGWINQLRIAFGASFLWLVCLIYFTQVCLLSLFFLVVSMRLSATASIFFVGHLLSRVFLVWSIFWFILEWNIIGFAAIFNFGEVGS